jgi:hypothetical protein
MFGTDALVAAILCAQLSSPCFTVRQNADAALRQMGPRAEPALILAAAGRNPEQRQRAERCLALLMPAKLERMFARNHHNGGVPWADSLPRTHPEYGQLYQAYSWDARVLASVGREEQKQYPLWRAVTRVWLTDEIYRGAITLDEAETLLGKMAARCVHWKDGKGWTDGEE